MAPIFLVRHALTGHNGPTEAEGKVRAGTDVPVSAEGQQQIAQIAQFFTGKPVARVLHSNTRRAGDTAAAIAKATGAQLLAHPGLEPWHGAKPGQDMKEAGPLLAELFRHHDRVGPGGESYRQFFDRLMTALHALKGGDVAVTHGRNVKAAMSLLKGGGRFHPALPPHDPSPTRPGDAFLATPGGLVKVFGMPRHGRKDTGS